VNVETFIYGLIFGSLIWFIAWRLGARPRPWREAVAWVLLYAGLTLAIKASGIVGGTESITIAFLGATLLVGAWNRFAHRRPNASSQRI
jgi:hypothetical protein